MNKIIIKKIIRKLFPSKKKKKDEIIKEFENSEAPEILLTSNDDKIIVKILSKKILPNSYIEIKHRSTGKRIEKKINKHVAIFSVKEIVDMGEEEIFDFYIKIKNNKSILKKRIKYNHNNQFFKVISEKNQIITPYSTKYHNISLNIEKKDFDHNIINLSIKDNKIAIAGNIILLNSEINDLDKIDIIGRNRLDSQSNAFNMDFKKLGNNIFSFEGIIDKIVVDEENLNLSMDFYIRIFYDNIYYQYLIDLTNYKDYSNDEDRFLLQIEKENKFYSLHTKAVVLLYFSQ